MGMSNYIIDLQEESCECLSCGESTTPEELSEIETCEYCQQQELQDIHNYY